ncbi:MAG: branched-chain amino acid ABC transporter permease [Candidatus Thiodiazotropha sp.]
MNYLLHLGIYLNIYIIVALSLNLVVGYLGRLSLTHAGYVALGGYAYALCTLKLGIGFLPIIAIAIALGVITSLALSLPAWRFKGDSFVMISLAVQAVIYGVIHNWTSPGAEPGTWTNLTNGPYGLAGIHKPDIFGIQFDTISSIFALSLVVMLICATVIFILTKSRWGLLLKCIRDDELALRSLGKNVRLLKLQAFAFSCAMAAVAGVIYSSYVGYIDPTMASLDESILFLSILCIGGLGNFRGPILGAMTLLLLPELLRLTPIPGSYAANVRLLVYGLLLVTVVHLRPQGIAGEYRIE